MRSVFLLVVLIGALLLGVAMLGLGAFPPASHPQHIERVLPNDRFGQHG